MAGAVRLDVAWRRSAWHGVAGMSTTTLHHQLQAIYDEHGDLTPPLVVEVARDPSHPLHARLEWDDSIGGERWRLEQAAQLIRCVRITYARDANGPKTLRAYTAIKGENTPRASYMPTEKVLADEFTRSLVLRDMEREWRLLRQRYDHMVEFAQMVARDLGQPEAASS